MDWLPIVSGIASSPYFQILSGVASLLSLAITVYLAQRLRSINGRIVFHARKGAWVSEVRDRASELARALDVSLAQQPDDTNYAPPVLSALSRIRPLVRSIRRSMPKFSYEWRQLVCIEAMTANELGHGFIGKLSVFCSPKTGSRMWAIYNRLLELAIYLDETVQNSNVYQEGA